MVSYIDTAVIICMYIILYTVKRLQGKASHLSGKWLAIYSKTFAVTLLETYIVDQQGYDL